MAKLSEILKSRGYVYQHSSEKLGEITDGPKRTVYLGVDPTADSIHVGNLAAYMLLRRFADAGHKVILLIGGGTGMIGDPKPDVERPLLSIEEITARSEKLKIQAEKVLGGLEVQLVNNYDWLGSLGLISFLRDTGKYFTVNSLIKKEAISARMKSEEGISFTEFSYPLLQAYDFWHLFNEYKCDVQIGGSDQWGNIVAGVELIRRKDNLKLFTLLSDAEIEAVMELHKRDHKERHAQKTLAREVTTLIHGANVSETVEKVSSVLFDDAGLGGLDEGALSMLKNAAPTHEVTAGNLILDVLVASKVASPKREARLFLKDKAVSLNGEMVTDEKQQLIPENFTSGVALLKRGKKNVCVLVLA